jgi:hypothetical protein
VKLRLIRVSGYAFASPGARTNCSTKDPCDGAFPLSLVVPTTYPTDHCDMKTGTGNLNVISSDNSTTIGTFAFKALTRRHCP